MTTSDAESASASTGTDETPSHWQFTETQRSRANHKGELGLSLAMLAGLHALAGGREDYADSDLLELRFVDEVLRPLRTNPATNGAKFASLFFQSESGFELAFKAACSFLAQAVNYTNRKDANSAAAWSLVCDATYWTGIAVGCARTQSQTNPAASRSAWARAAAHARHRENHSMKAQVFDWCDTESNGFKSMDAMAEAVAGKVVPVSFRTARTWISEWRRLRAVA